MTNEDGITVLETQISGRVPDVKEWLSRCWGMIAMDERRHLRAAVFGRFC
ncbi:hypothetical protein [Pseudomonas chlororaphis]|nr:hypothetical protein [Pseudomonas chlororaphis]